MRRGPRLYAGASSDCSSVRQQASLPLTYVKASAVASRMSPQAGQRHMCITDSQLGQPPLGVQQGAACSALHTKPCFTNDLTERTSCCARSPAWSSRRSRRPGLWRARPAGRRACGPARVRTPLRLRDARAVSGIGNRGSMWCCQEVHAATGVATLASRAQDRLGRA